MKQSLDNIKGLVDLNEHDLTAINGGDDITVGAFAGAVLSGALVGAAGGGPVGALVGIGGAALGFGAGLLYNYYTQ